MTRRPLAHPVGRMVRAQDRMAPGGRVWSESPVPGRYSPRVPMAGEDAPATPPVTMAFGANSSRYSGESPTTANVFKVLSVGAAKPPITGDPAAAVVVAEGPTVTAPAGWTTLASGSLGSSVTWRLAAVNSAPAGLSDVWSMPGAVRWASAAWAPTRLPDSTSPMSSYTWEAQVGTPTTSGDTGTWLPPTGPGWLYCVSGFVAEIGGQGPATPRVNSLGNPYVTAGENGGTGTAKCRVFFAIPSPFVPSGNDVADYFRVGGVDSLGRVWHPDNTFAWSAYSPGTVKLPFLLGLK